MGLCVEYPKRMRTSSEVRALLESFVGPRPMSSIPIRITAVLALAGVISMALPSSGIRANSQLGAVDIDVGSNHSCAILAGGSVRCWGSNEYGKLGMGQISPPTVSSPSRYGDVPMGISVNQISLGDSHSCVLTTSGSVRCFGSAISGQLGYGNTNSVGDNETPASIGDVPLGGVAIAISAGAYHTCALMTSGSVRCWGDGADGRLGYGQGLNQFGNVENLGDNETPSSVGDVPLGGTAQAISAGAEHTCALMSTGSVRCWGKGTYGRLGYGNTASIGDNENPASVGDVPLGGAAVAIAAGGYLTCALMSTGLVRCWGRQHLGYGGNRVLVGDDEIPASVGDVPLGGFAKGLSAGWESVCAHMTSDSIRCWGDGASLQLGYGNRNNVGDDETPASVGDVQVGQGVLKVAIGSGHTCVILQSTSVRCWGYGAYGQLGNGSTGSLGFNTTPSLIADLNLSAPVVTPTSAPSTTSSGTPPASSAASTSVPSQVTTDLTLKVGKSRLIRSVLAAKNIPQPKGSRILVVVDAKSRSRCSYKNSSIRALKKGTCAISISISQKNAKMKRYRLNIQLS